MIKLQDSQITQILPEYLSERESVQALSFALHKAIERLIRHCGNISVFSAIDTASGNILDLLAEELDTQYYDDSLPIDAKRKLIQNTLSWYMGTGTPGAVEELVTAVYGHGEVEEWFEYGGEPHFFRISITNMEVKPGQNKEFRHILSKIKRLSAHLDAIRYVFHEEINQPIRYELAMTFAGAFWPRRNAPRHYLNGATQLDGRYPLSGYLSGQSLDFYPAALQISCEAGERAKAAADGRTAVCCGAAETAESEAALCIRGEENAGATSAGGMQVSAGAGEAGRMAAAGQAVIRGNAAEAAAGVARLLACGVASARTDTGAGTGISGGARATSSAAGGLVVERAWGTLDGSGQLDGSRLLNAARYEVEV